MNVRTLLREYHALHARQYKGDYNAVCALVDLRRAITLADLTERQQEALAWIYGADLTQEDVGERMNTTQPAVSLAIDSAIVKIQRIYDDWSSLEDAG
ncbi:sigma factor-like helix-turn-helix DNA-binding protein [Bacillus chungangensis]|uniref:DNA-directed RNA polymerase specialized sigma subunit n=1 Tax=Bacillus chungangensis TaxID=587633 RepID=A0ABT9WM78_9BACI|nr:sigma factor-like helix-turn-helix DNA-binding protein [Bacillus chungangensis]MDQ0174400.1 DNA-directed RNA polymerase specialized sigma subunit [Bacillus chungangensis]